MVGTVRTESIGMSTSNKKGMPMTTMVECLDNNNNDPIVALRTIAISSVEQAIYHAKELHKITNGVKEDGITPIWQISPPSLLSSKDSIISIPSTSSTSSTEKISSLTLTSFKDDHPIRTVSACAESVTSSLNKISLGGKQASHEIRILENNKRTLDHHAAVIMAAVTLRKQSTYAAQSFTSELYYDCAEAIRPWLLWKQQQEQEQGKHGNNNTNSNDDPDHDGGSNNNNNIMNDPRVTIYAGEYSLQQLEITYTKLRNKLLQLYEIAVQTSNLQQLGQLTPILSMIQLEQDGLRLYKVYLQSVLEQSMKDAIEQPIPPVPAAAGVGVKNNTKQPNVQSPPPPYVTMGRIYNTAVSILRHHLPMVSHCLHRADGDVSIVQLVHVQTEHAILPILRQYQKERQLSRVARTATQIYTAIEDRYTGRGMGESNDTNNTMNDCGFSEQIGTLVDVDITMEEVAKCIQHTESYIRFVKHTCIEVNRARQIRYEQMIERQRIEKERNEWTKTGKTSRTISSNTDHETEVTPYHDIEILPNSTPLHESIAEVGGQYAAIERCLLIASLQRAFDNSYDIDDPKSYRPMSTLSSASTSSSTASHTITSSNTVTDAWQTLLVETSWYAVRRCTQRAFATGHTGTASAVTNFVVECFTDVCLQVLTRRSEEYGIQPLKPGEGLLIGSMNIFNNASNLIRQGGGAVTGLQLPTSVVTTTTTTGSNNSHNKNKNDELVRKQKREEGIIRACAMINDLEVAVHHTQQLEGILNKLIDKGFAPNTHETEHLRMCVKSLGPVADAFQYASNTTIEGLESILKPRIRSIVNDAIGISDISSSTFMGAVTTTKTNDREMIRMNYDLDEDAYNLLQLSEGYVSRLCVLLDELLVPLRRHLAPRLWDMLLLHVMSTVCKRLEISLRKCDYTALGGLTLESDIRDLLSYTKDHLQSPEYYSNTVAVIKACPPLSKLLQVAKLLTVDDLDDVLDLILNSKRKGNWDLKLEDAKVFLCLRVEFDSDKVNELLRLPDED